MSACGKCHGTDCVNTQPAVMEKVDDEPDGDDEFENGGEPDGYDMSDDVSAVLYDDDIDWFYEESVL
jgi:hypothetical protein